MLHKSLAKRRDEDGFTLIELLVVVVIIGILIGIAVPVYLNYRKSANDKAAQSDLRGAISTLELCNSDNGTYPADSAFTAGATAGAAGNACANQAVSVSSGTVLKYTYVSATAYKLVSNNSGGTDKKWYCYSSATGGSVRSLDNMATAAAATTACT